MRCETTPGHLFPPDQTCYNALPSSYISTTFPRTNSHSSAFLELLLLSQRALCWLCSLRAPSALRTLLWTSKTCTAVSCHISATNTTQAPHDLFIQLPLVSHVSFTSFYLIYKSVVMLYFAFSRELNISVLHVVCRVPLCLRLF